LPPESLIIILQFDLKKIDFIINLNNYMTQNYLDTEIILNKHLMIKYILSILLNLIMTKL